MDLPGTLVDEEGAFCLELVKLPTYFEFREVVLEIGLVVGCGPAKKLAGSARFFAGRDRKSEGSATRFLELREEKSSSSELAIRSLSDAWRSVSLLFGDRLADLLGGERSDHPRRRLGSGLLGSASCDLLADQSRLTVPRPDRTCEDALDLHS